MEKQALNPYPAYKPPGIPWLPQVPGHWSEMKVKYIFRERVQKGYPNEPLLAATQSMGVVTKEAYGERTVTAQKDLHLLKLVEKNDFVISLRSFQGGIEVSHARGIISPAYTILRISRECAPGYLAFLLKSAPFIDGLKLFITGIREGQNIDYARLARTYLPWPPVEEQHLIVRYLRALDAKVKRYIRTKRKLIAALQEQKQAIIQRAVTRGLDPERSPGAPSGVKLKPSGVEWLGEVPEHWEVVRFKRLLKRVEQGVSPQAESYLAEGNAWGVLKAGCINRGVFRETEHKRLPNGYAVDRSLQVKAGDVLVSRASGSPSLVGSVGIVEEVQRQLILSDKTFRPVFHDARMKRFCVAAMNTRYFRHQVEQAISGAEGLANNLPLTSLKDFNLIVPPPEEAEFIAAHLVKETAQFDTALAALDRDIHLIHEYHTRLIADVVTGAVDVREAARKLPEEDQMIGRSDDQMMEEEVLSLAAEGEAEYGEPKER